MQAGPHNRWLGYQDMPAHDSLAYAPNSKKEGAWVGRGLKSSGSNRPGPSPQPLGLWSVLAKLLKGVAHPGARQGGLAGLQGPLALE